LGTTPDPRRASSFVLCTPREAEGRGATCSNTEQERQREWTQTAAHQASNNHAGTSRDGAFGERCPLRSALPRVLRPKPRWVRAWSDLVLCSRNKSVQEVSAPLSGATHLPMEVPEHARTNQAPDHRADGGRHVSENDWSKNRPCIIALPKHVHEAEIRVLLQHSSCHTSCGLTA
jgi:hypothetical protein